MMHAHGHHAVRHRPHFPHSNETCVLGGQTGDSTWFGLQIIITLLNVSAILSNIIFVVVCTRAGVMHRNMRLMLSTISACFAVNASAGFLYNIYFFYLGVYGFPMIPSHSSWCFIINAGLIPWDAAACILMIGVGAERLIATKRHIPSGAISRVVKIIFLLAWGAALFVTVNYVLNYREDALCVCDGASLGDKFAMLTRIAVCAVVEIGTIAIFLYVLILSRNQADGLGINTAKYSLSQRFQIYETYRTTEMLLPSVVLHAILYLGYLLLIIPVRELRAEPDLTIFQFNMSTIIFAFPSIHALSHPLICLSRHYYLRQRVDDLLQNILPRAPPAIALQSSSPNERSRLDDSPELSSSPSFRSDSGRVDFRVGPDRHAEILESFWEKK